MRFLEIMGLLNQVYLTNNLINWTDWLNDFCVLRVTEWFLVWPPIYSVFSTLWHLFCIDSFHMVHNQAKWFKYILFPNSWKAWSNLHICKRGPIKSVLFICPSVCLSACLSVCLSVCLWHFCQDLLSGFP